MQLSYNGWPPVASHLACIFMGLAFANFFMSHQAKSAIYLSHHFTVPLPTSQLSKNPLPSFGKNERILLVKDQEPGTPICRLKFKTVLFLQNEPLILGFLPTDLSEIQTLFSRKNKGKISFRKAEQGPDIKICHDKPRISYGTQ
jgi:hypothetical protein